MRVSGVGCPRVEVVGVEDGGSAKLAPVGGASETARGGWRNSRELREAMEGLLVR